ncbi:MAG: hypothetical protein UY15_C0004G0017 [Parcubacteria group bacterium GW2011_GWA2_47_9]|nr:MAG: hypothetical protein UY15_C0004G0017 [Parcubacteria group bacterium GW2011_GWA2_47_9]
MSLIGYGLMFGSLFAGISLYLVTGDDLSWLMVGALSGVVFIGMLIAVRGMR